MRPQTDWVICTRSHSLEAADLGFRPGSLSSEPMPSAYTSSFPSVNWAVLGSPTPWSSADEIECSLSVSPPVGTVDIVGQVFVESL